MKFFTGHINSFSSPNNVFVFGSNSAGRHGAGSAKIAVEKFGAIFGQDEGLQGQSYAIPTVDGKIRPLDRGLIQDSANDFLAHVRSNPSKTYWLTEIGTGIAGFSVVEMANLFRHGVNLPNLIFAESFARILYVRGNSEALGDYIEVKP